MKKKKGKNKLLRKKDIARFFLPSLVIVLALCLLGCILDNALGLTEYLFGSGEEAGNIVTDFFLVEVQVTFIVVSLSTVLSTQSKRVYWVDSFQYRLIRPKYTNFTALSSYILSTLVVGIILEILDRCIKDFSGIMGVFVSFVLSVVLMIVLSMRMIGANFGEEAIKAELEEELREYKEKQRVMEHIGYDAGLRIPMIRELVQVTYQEAEERQLDLVCENLDLLFRMGFTHELKRCYSYVRKTLQSPEIMAEIDFSLMRSAVLSNELSFFYMDCPLPLDSLLRWWEEMIDERFDEAIVLWKEGRKDEAKTIRRDLFILFTQSLFYQLGNYDCTDEEMPEMQKYDVIRLMGRFVMRRTDAVGSYDSNGEPIELDKEWAESEKNMLDDEDQIRDAESLVSFAARTLDEWVAGNCSETINEWLEADACTLFQAEKF